MFNKRIRIKEVLGMEPEQQEITVMGWVRSFRNNQFVALTDGSTNNTLQVVLELGKFDEALLKRITTSASIKATGVLVPSLGKGQKMDLKADTVEILGDCDPEKYPLQPKNRPSLEYLRERAHLRFRTNTFGAVFRIRHALAFAVHKFFNEKGFIYLHTPIITASDAEGAGEMFRVTTLPTKNIQLRNKNLEEQATRYTNWLLNKMPIQKVKEWNQTFKHIGGEFDLFKTIEARPAQLKQLTELRKKYALIDNYVNEVLSFCQGVLFEPGAAGDVFTEEAAHILGVEPGKQIVRRFSMKNYPFLALSFFNFAQINRRVKNSNESEIDFENDFFGKPTNLTVSGQLEGELGATAFGEIYTFGPTFRAENSNTTRHLAEFWMIEPEMAFYDLKDNADLAEEFIKYLIRYVMENNIDDLQFLHERLIEEEKTKVQAERSEINLLQKLMFVLENKFERITYTEAIEILLQSPHYKKKKFQYDVKWGIDMQSEHERYLVEKHFKKPVVVTNYPAAIKSFYMRVDDGCAPERQTVAAMDILAPGIGEIVGGSQREERYDVLVNRMKEMGVPTEELWWYLDTRRYGTVPHAGFGLGFERMVQFVTGMGNIRDVIAFPRTPKNAEF